MSANDGDVSMSDGQRTWEVRIRLSWVEFFTAFSMLAVAALLVPAFRAGWTFALVPGLTYLLAVGAAYRLYRQYARERADASRTRAGAAFRVVDVRGVCPLGRRTGDLIAVDPAGVVAPELCEPAREVFRLAASAGDGRVEQWCCPIYEHQLVFQQERAAA